jgi:hypothetical protein
MTQDKHNSTNPFVQFVSNSIRTVVNCTTNTPADNTIPQNTEGDQVLTCSITPKFSNSILEIFFSGQIASDATFPASVTVALFQDATANALAARCFDMFGTDQLFGQLKYVMTSGTTSSTTFKIRVGKSTATCYLNANFTGTNMYGNTTNSVLTIVEHL